VRFDQRNDLLQRRAAVITTGFNMIFCGLQRLVGGEIIAAMVLEL
jgi:hypothetical protein